MSNARSMAAVGDLCPLITIEEPADGTSPPPSWVRDLAH